MNISRIFIKQFPEDVQLCLKRKTYQSIKKRVLSSVTAPEEELIKSSIKEKLLKHFQVQKLTLESALYPIILRNSHLCKHRHVNHVLQDELKGPVHALAIETFTPSQWESNEIRRNKSPPCRGGKRV
ncbi:putative bolA-like protein K11H12.1 isoform X3 [Tachypleus tridentatus]|uniref:putative bolA-like protein K11H12.1 isoform X3 n=1 Tax=Tachypleus tridentatus TaxID=6853 RepID=UPI003FD5EF75